MNIEINKQIAEKVFGCKLFDDCYEIPSGMAALPYCNLPDYSGDISAAWQVVENIKCNKFLIIKNKNIDYEATIITAAACIVYTNYRKTAPMAICAVALRYLEQEDNNKDTPLKIKSVKRKMSAYLKLGGNEDADL